MNEELLDALTVLEREKNISREVLIEAIEESLRQACRNHFGRNENIHVFVDPKTCDFELYAEKTVVEEVGDPLLEISLPNAQKIVRKANVGDVVRVPIQSKEFGRIAAQNGVSVIRQKIREGTKQANTEYYKEQEKEVVTGIVQRYVGENISINLGRADAMLNRAEQVPGERFRPTERIKVYIVKVDETSKGPRITVSRKHPDMVKRLFEAEVTEIKSGVVEIMAISREAGSRTKMAVRSNDPNVDAVGACVGLNGSRVNAVVQELRGEKIDIIRWDDDPRFLIENALSPAKVICVAADEREKSAVVIVPDSQLSLAIGKEGMNARLVARLTQYSKIDIQSETQSKESGLWATLGLDQTDEEGQFDYILDDEVPMDSEADKEYDGEIEAQETDEQGE